MTKDEISRISQGLDQRYGGNHHATQTTDAKKFVYTENVFGTLPGWYSDGVDDVMDIADLFNHLSGNDVPYTYYFVGKWPDTNYSTTRQNTLAFFNSNWTTTIRNALFPYQSTIDLYRMDDASTVIQLQPSFSPNASPFLWAIYFSGTTITAKFNATTIQNEGAMNVGTTTLTTATIGARGFGSAGWNDDYFKGYHGEHAMYDSNLLGTANDTKFRSYVNSRYGITV